MYQPLDAVPAIPSLIGRVPTKARHVVSYRLIGMPDGCAPCRLYVMAFSRQQAMAAWMKDMGTRLDAFELLDVSLFGEIA